MNEVIESIRNGNSNAMSRLREKYRNIDEISLPEGSVLLLECLGNLCANEMFVGEEIFDPVEKLNENKEKLELKINAKNSKNTYDGTVTLVAYNNDLLHYIDVKEFNQKYEKDLLDELKSIDYQFKNVYLLENLDEKRLIRIK